MPVVQEIFTPPALKSLPHRRLCRWCTSAPAGRGEGIGRLLGPLGTRGNEVMKQQCAAGREEPGGGAGRLHHLQRLQEHPDMAAEAQAKTGHDIQQFPGWEAQNHADQLEPMDDVMKRLTAKYGPVAAASEYLFKKKGHWVAVPCSSGNQNKGPCGRISRAEESRGWTS